MTAMGHPSTLTNQPPQHHHEVNLTKHHQGVLPRAQSSLELLSQTAIEIESANSSPRSLILSRASSPATRVTPNVVSETLVLPELVHKATMVGFPLHNEDENISNNNNNGIKGLLHKNHLHHHHGPTLMPRPAADYGNGSLASLMREPSGLYVTLLGGNSHPTAGGAANLQSFPDHGLYHSSSFSSSCGGSFHQPTTTVTTTATTTTAPEPSSSSASATVVSTTSSSANPTGHYDPSSLSHQQSAENGWLRRELAAKDSTIATLQIQVQNLTQEIRQLRQLPTGKISQIPLEDMLSIMREYGSEVSDMAMPPRKAYVQKASVVRQFRRWNPHFLEWFEHVNGRWVPKLGREGELRRRQQARQEAVTHRGSGGNNNKDGKRGSTSSPKKNTSSNKKSKSS